MRLKRLEMVGFKSFADKTRVEFEPGITAIVGPNGCGKSNISDCIRWVLGETSAKSLRSGHMMDVIFNGTANRPQLGMAEVALTFDNASHQIPIDYSEVTVSRRLFRSGESEYYINKTQCRLKDLKELFLDTGVGNDGYYVMAQGKIEFILSSKPEDRRELFEEAAGVSKYKARREEAIRRLNKVEQDMLRLNDSLAIYKQQMDSLDTAVRKAKTHQKLQEELRTLEITHFLHGFQKAQADWGTVQTQREEAEKQFDALRTELTERETALVQARTRSETMEEEVLVLQRQVAQCESDWARTEAERRAAQEREGELQATQERLKNDEATLSQTLEETRSAQTQLSFQVAEARAQFEEKNARYKEEDQKGRTDQDGAQEQQRALDAIKTRLLELARLISHHRNETVRLTSLSIRHDEASKAKQRELEKVQMRRAAIDEQIQQHETIAAETVAKLAAAQEALQALDEQQARDQATLVETEKSIQSGRERLARLEAERVSLERWLAQDPVAMAATALQSHSIPGVYGPVSALLKTAPTHQRLLDRALGDRAHWFVAETFSDAQVAVRYLSEQRQGWATFLILDRLSQQEPYVPQEQSDGRSLAVQVDCEEKFRPVQQLLLSKTYYVGATLFEETLVRGGADPEQESFQATPTDLNRLNSELSTLKEQLGQFTQQRETLQQAIRERQSQRGPMQSELNKIQVTNQVQNQGLNRLRDDRQMADTEEKLLTHERDEALAAIQQAQKALADEEVLLTTLEMEQGTMGDSLQKQDDALTQLRQRIQTHQAHVSQLRLEAETTRERLIGQEREEENVRRQLASLDQRLKNAQNEQLQSAERLAQVIQIQQEKSQSLEGLQKVREEQQGRLNELLAERQSVQEKLHGEDQALSQLRQSVSSAQSRAQEAEFQTRTLEQEKIRMEESLRASYQLSIDEARAQFGEITPPNPEELARVRRRLENMGPVNLAAPEEHAQLEERFQFLLTQQADLLKAKEDLHQAIQKINATTRDHFKTTFETVRQNFKMLYQTLFQGGEADVILTDQSNVLESGIDILACPPGKKLQSINLLSGGEKALTAIALLFAFFMVKPSPFCLLDEVDAPLDEANVGRFLRMVKSFSEKTQFIVITHNKRTMEMADVLYGVTMAELGVSTLISVKMESRNTAGAAA